MILIFVKAFASKAMLGLMLLLAACNSKQEPHQIEKSQSSIANGEKQNLQEVEKEAVESLSLVIAEVDQNNPGDPEASKFLVMKLKSQPDTASLQEANYNKEYLRQIRTFIRSSSQESEQVSYAYIDPSGKIIDIISQDILASGCYYFAYDSEEKFLIIDNRKIFEDVEAMVSDLKISLTLSTGGRLCINEKKHLAYVDNACSFSLPEFSNQQFVDYLRERKLVANKFVNSEGLNLAASFFGFGTKSAKKPEINKIRDDRLKYPPDIVLTVGAFFQNIGKKMPPVTKGPKSLVSRSQIAKKDRLVEHLRGEFPRYTEDEIRTYLGVLKPNQKFLLGAGESGVQYRLHKKGDVTLLQKNISPSGSREKWINEMSL